MKQLIALLALAAGTASATPLGFVKYDYGRTSSGSTQEEVDVGVAWRTSIGTVSAAIVTARSFTPKVDSSRGFSISYANTYFAQGYALTGQAEYGRQNIVEGPGGFSGHISYYSLALQALVPLSNGVTGFVGYRHRNGDEGVTSNRFIAGTDISLTSRSALRIGYVHTRQGSFTFNGLTTGIAYAF